MKWVVFIGAVLLTAPFGDWLAGRPYARRWLWAAIPFLTFYGLDAFKINVVSYELYRGDSRGIEITIVDLFAVALARALPEARGPAPLRVPVALYALVTVLSVLHAESPLFATFSVWKFARMIVFARVVTRGCEDPSVPPWILRGMAAGVIYELGVALHQRYVLHHHQVSGDFAHQNTFGMAVNLVMPFVLALRLAGGGGRLAVPTLLAGASCIVLTLSRGAMSMLLLGSAIVFTVSTARRPTLAKLRTAALGVAAAGAMLSRAWSTIVDRFVNAPKESAEGREQFEAAARLMLSDHPLGIGMNGYSLALGEAGYGARVGVYGYDATGIVHNIYWLTAAEVGYPGIVAFLVLLAAPIVIAARAVLRASPDDPRADVLLGLAVGLVLMDLQGQLEWAFRQTTLSYLFWIIVGVITALARDIEVRA